jgi:glycine/D-amino acid oxidase-like deaminating enzyme/nitrite reductase/ring-hydroxylating ferredoxin subunit
MSVQSGNVVDASVWRSRPRSFTSDPMPTRADDVVIGAGLAGLVTGLLLARAGRQVAVVEAGQSLGGGTTGASSAKISLLHGTHLSEITQRHGHSVAMAYLEANREGQAWLRRFCDTHEVPYQVRDAITFATEESSVPQLEAEYAAERELGLPSAWTTSIDVPFPFHAGIVLADQFQIDPMDLVDKLAERVRDHGGTVSLGHRVVDVGHGQPLTVQCDTGEMVEADHVVVATGTPILNRGLQFATLQARRSYELAIGGATAPHGMFLSVGDPVVSIRDIPDRDLVLVGGFGHPTGRTDSESDHLQRLREWALTHFPDATVQHAWSAQDYRSYDVLPDVRVLPYSRSRIHVLTGFDKWGFTNAVAAALTVAAGTLGTPPPWAEEAYSGHVSGSIFDLGAFNSSVVAEAARGASACLRQLGPEPPADGTGKVGRRGLRAVGVSTVDDDVREVRPVCTHLGGVVRWNDAERTWDCPLHGSRFTPTGEVIEGPAVLPLDDV